MKIYTKTGDDGTTSLFGGRRVPKDDARLNAYGSLDELNAWLGKAGCEAVDNKTNSIVVYLQNLLFKACSDLATPYGDEGNTGRIQRVDEQDIKNVEKWIDDIDGGLPELKNFILPGGTAAASSLHLGRTVCRRAEREIITLSAKEQINPNLVIFVNRISDLLFVLARHENKSAGRTDVVWNNKL